MDSARRHPITSPIHEPGLSIFSNRSPHQLTLGVFAAAGGFTLLVWGSRIGLLTGVERADLASWLRIGGSIGFGLTLLLLAMLMWLTESPSGWSQPAAWGFLVFNLAIWVPSVLRVVPGNDSAAFKGVHVVLAIGSVGLAALTVWATSRPPIYSRTTSTQMASNTSAR